MSDLSGLHDELIFAYIDGELDEQQSVELDALRAADASIQERIDSLRAINRTIYGLSDQPSRALDFTRGKPRRLSRKWVAYAAVLAITSVLFLYMNPRAPQRTIHAQRFYISTTTEFVPDIVCDTPAKFEAYTLESFGKTITADFEGSIQLVGWKYLMKGYKPKDGVDVKVTRVLVGVAPDGTPLLAIFPAKDFPALKLKTGSGFHIYRRTINSVKVIEISPLDSPMILDVLSKK